MLDSPFACLVTRAGCGSEPDDADADRRHCSERICMKLRVGLRIVSFCRLVQCHLEFSLSLYTHIYIHIREPAFILYIALLFRGQSYQRRIRADQGVTAGSTKSAAGLHLNSEEIGPCPIFRSWAPSYGSTILKRAKASPLRLQAHY